MTFEDDRLAGLKYERFFGDYLLRRGWDVLFINDEVERPQTVDTGDLQIGKVIEGVFQTWTMDVKHNRNWRTARFPFPTIYLCTQDNFHADWLYVVMKPDYSRYAYIPGEDVKPEQITLDQTRNPRLVEQVSLAVDIDCATFHRIQT